MRPPYMASGRATAPRTKLRRDVGAFRSALACDSLLVVIEVFAEEAFIIKDHGAVGARDCTDGFPVWKSRMIRISGACKLNPRIAHLRG